MSKPLFKRPLLSRAAADEAKVELARAKSACRRWRRRRSRSAPGQGKVKVKAVKAVKTKAKVQR